MLHNHSIASRHLRVVIINNSPHVLRLLCERFKQHGYYCQALLHSDMRRAQNEVDEFVAAHRPHVVVYDVGTPYASSWDLLEVIRMSAWLCSQPFVITTPSKRKLELAVGATSAIEIGGEPGLRAVLKAVEAAARDAPRR